MVVRASAVGIALLTLLPQVGFAQEEQPDAGAQQPDAGIEEEQPVPPPRPLRPPVRQVPPPQWPPPGPIRPVRHWDCPLSSLWHLIHAGIGTDVASTSPIQTLLVDGGIGLLCVHNEAGDAEKF